MSYTSLGYMLFVACCLIFYYIFPKKHRWWVLLAASIGLCNSMPEVHQLRFRDRSQHLRRRPDTRGICEQA